MTTKTSERDLLPMSKKQETFNIKVERKLENKIRRLCKELPTLEWSGALFYTHEGSVKDGNLKINAVDLYLMDIGSSTYTDFHKDSNIIAYMIEKDLLECEVGLIHSHDTMPTFFSGTDMSTLQDEGTDMNHFVSLIVNNEGKYTAAITCKVENNFEGKVKQSALTFNDEKQLLKEKPYTTSTKGIVYWDLNIEVENVKEIIEDEEDKEIIERLTTIKEDKEKERERKRKAAEEYWSKHGYDWDNQGYDFEYPNSYSRQKDTKQLTLFDIPPKKSEPTRIVYKYNATEIAAKIVTLNPCCTATSNIELKLQIKKHLPEFVKLNLALDAYGSLDAYIEAYITYILDSYQLYEDLTEEMQDSMNEQQFGQYFETIQIKFLRVINIVEDLIKEFPSLEKLYSNIVKVLQFELECAL